MKQYNQYEYLLFLVRYKISKVYNFNLRSAVFAGLRSVRGV